jgi:hypothetical protein
MRIHSPHFLLFDSAGAINKDELVQQAAKYLDTAYAPPTDTAARFMRRRLDHQFRWTVTPVIFGNIADAVFGIGGWVVPPRRGVGPGTLRLSAWHFHTLLPGTLGCQNGLKDREWTSTKELAESYFTR